jgi:hypothetical protein
MIKNDKEHRRMLIACKVILNKVLPKSPESLQLTDVTIFYKLVGYLFRCLSNIYNTNPTIATPKFQAYLFRVP